jgi:acrylyl-CoA reductase (NADPH)
MQKDNKMRALITYEEASGYKRQIEKLDIPKLSVGEILIKAQYSSLNYKDALSASGHKGITRTYPHIAGIDVAGTVKESKSSDWQKGDEVICTGFDLGMNINGGFAEYVAVPGNWCLKRPKDLSLKETMIFGTAGLTAALSALNIINHDLLPEGNKILITGATGGVGLLSALLMHKLGFMVTATTRNPKNSFLKSYKFANVIATDSLNTSSNKPLNQRQYNAAIDTLGGNILSNILKIIDYNGAVISCGNILGNDFNTSVLPMILRGISLIGVTSANATMDNRKQAWQLLGQNKALINDSIYREIGLNELSEYIDNMLQGNHSKRTIIAF